MQESHNTAKPEAGDLSFLYDFVSECPNPIISESIKSLVTGWLSDSSKTPHLSAAIKARLALTNEELIEVGWLLAINPLTPPSVLADLCVEGSPQILERIAENRNAWPSTLGSLSYQALAEIRIAAAGNPHTPLATIMILIKDDNPDVRFSIAENPNIPTEVLQLLARNDNPFVQMRAEKTLKRLDLEGKLQAAEALAKGAAG